MDRGFALAEVIVTVTLVAVGGVALAGSIAVAARAVNHGRLETDAMIAARNELEVLRALPHDCTDAGRHERVLSNGRLWGQVAPAGPVGALRITATSVVSAPQRSIHVSLTTVVPCAR
jgi:Tfp pilus assembly protein PilV